MTAVEIDGTEIVADVMAGLKGFQRKTVDHVFRRMFESHEPSTRFLVADEVGLGKTLVARGLIAKTIEWHQKRKTKRIDVIYICSNADIARQNIRRLNVTDQSDFSLATRITLLPLQLQQLNDNGLNFISFTPGTSFNMASRGGIAQERAVIFHLLKKALGPDAVDHDGTYRLLKGGKGEQGFRNQVAWVGTQPLDKGLTKAFVTEFRARPELRKRVRQTIRKLRESEAAVDWNTKWNVISELRQTLAKSCVEALEPDLVILDEFQRFKDLLDEPNPDDSDDIRALAHHLFAQKDVRILLLSATPYKMYTLSDEPGDDHYADFLQTCRFLMSKEDATEFTGELRDFRRALFNFETVGEEGLLRRKRSVERRLRHVMVRTERLAVTEDRSGMLADRKLTARLEPNDVRNFAMVDRLSRALSAGDPTDYWKSAPYLLNFMEGYQLKRNLKAALATGDGVDLAAAIDPDLLIPAGRLGRYGALDPGNARLRGVADDLLDSESWRLLWMPPSLPYYEPGGPFAHPQAASLTKRLIFSSWAMVPPAISAVLSYDAERQMMRSRDRQARNNAAARRRIRGLLALNRAEGEPAGMSTFALLYPSPSLAELGDPLAIARDLGAADGPVSRDALSAEVKRRIEKALSPLVKRAPQEGPEDERWYWAAALLLDRKRDSDSTERWLTQSTAFRGLSHGASTEEGEDSSGWLTHVDRAISAVREELDLSRVPADLASALTALAIAGPGVCGLRTTARVLARVRAQRIDYRAAESRDAGARIAWGLRSLFNVPEVMSLVRGPVGDESVYWRAVLDYSIDGNIQAMLDEYGHVLPEWLGLLDRDSHAIAQAMSEAITETASVRAVNYGADDVRINDGKISLSPMRLRVRFAMRFGADQSDEEKVLQRSGAVRAAFNSPFWPFVLTSTSVGQEGLDFHQYCHAVVHWNLPSNPVDLEQREGRVHRYKGHAIRKNVATRHRSMAFGRRVTDPWTAMFTEASRGVARRDHKDIEPFWVYDGPAQIERLVPLIPLSREVERLERLKRSLAVYRMVFGQPRQEDLIAFLGNKLTPAELTELSQVLRINLAP
ncbi:MAG: helicase-related protein [Chloroflexota bacterium]